MDETEHGPEEHNTHLTPNGDLSGILPNQDLAIDRSYPEGTRPKILSAGCASVLSSLGVDTENATAMEDIREEKIKKWKQAGGALRRVLSKITKNKNKNVYPNKVDKSNGNHGAAVNKESNNSHKGKSCKRGRPRAKAEGTEDSRNSQNDPMNEMLAEFKMNSADSGQGLDDSRPASVEHHAKSQDPPTPTSTRQLSTFAELKEKIRRMTSGSNSGGASKQSNAAPSNVTKKRHKILRHSKSQDSSEKRQSESTESESDDFRPQRQHKPITRHHSTKEKRKSIDNAAFSFLKCSLGPSLSQVGENGSRTQDSLDVSDAILSDGEIPPLKLKHSEPSSKQGLVLSNQSLPKGPLNRRTAELLKEADSFANLADVESEGELNGDDIIDASCEVHLQNVLKDANHSNSEESVHTLCSTSEEEQAAAGQIRDEKYAKKSSAARPLKANSWAIGDDGSDDDSDLFDDLPDLRLHLPNTSSSDGDGSPILRISHADIDRLPSILSDSSSSEEEAADADDEFECDCPLCRYSRSGNRDSGWPPGGALEEAGRAMFQDSEDEVARAREFAALLFNTQGRSDSVLDLMFQNVILQMISVYPDLLSDQAPPPVSPALFEALPTISIDQSHLDSDNSCPICLCNFEMDEEAKLLQCQHYFHTLCIQAWLKKSGTCPVCRHVLANSGATS